MKRMPLKWKITLWYAGMLLVLIFLVLGFLLYNSEQMLRSESVSKLEDMVWDFVDGIHLDGGSYELDEDIRFYEGSVVFSIYDSEGRLLYGSIPSGFPERTTLRAYGIQEFTGLDETWTTYDIMIPYGNGQTLWARGVNTAETLTTVEHLVVRLLLIVCPLLILVALLVGYSITRRALLPVQEICRTADEIGGGVDLSRRIPDAGAGGEMKQLTDTFNHMFIRLERSFAQERQFTSDASHELRTPIAVIRSQAEYALMEDATEEERREGLEVILKQSEQMSSLVSRLLTLARADSGRQALQKVPVDLGQTASAAADKVMEKAEKRGIAIQRRIMPELEVTGDGGSLDQVFVNLLENAVQYGREGGNICLTVEQEEGEAVCRVEDDGMGIAPEHLDKIWNRFYRVDEAHGSEQGNSGLGLSLVKWIVEAHGGRVCVESEPGKGSCFTVPLPLEDGTVRSGTERRRRLS